MLLLIEVAAMKYGVRLTSICRGGQLFMAMERDGHSAVASVMQQLVDCRTDVSPRLL
jgi:hypothetical protein